ncbi:hypothetical protein E2C01_101596 [Portunus trituberculatus]|uniref:Uncharacterized protein n=1 Tax=Portunus trituberculatus TaxID=210409 RepID=A0A5B7KGF8_PORTR|nr:hypothetical protein [Portunus trituberculatus]
MLAAVRGAAGLPDALGEGRAATLAPLPHNSSLYDSLNSMRRKYGQLLLLVRKVLEACSVQAAKNKNRKIKAAAGDHQAYRWKSLCEQN